MRILGNKLSALLITFALCLSAQTFAASVQAICSHVHYDFNNNGGVCMPGNDHGFINAAKCNQIYFCALHGAYNQFIEEDGAQPQVNNQLIGTKGPSKNTTFDTFDVQNGPFSTAYNGQLKTNDLTWLTEYKQMRNKVVSNVTLIRLYHEAQQNPSLKKQADEALALYIHQLLGMPPQGYSDHSNANPYTGTGLFIIHSNNNHSLNSDDDNPDLNELDTVTLHYDNLTSIDNTHAFVFRLCRSTFSLNNSSQKNYCGNTDTNIAQMNPGYRIWTAKWMQGAYPSNISAGNYRSQQLCTGHGMTNCLNYYPWTSIGNTYNWSHFDNSDSAQGMYDGLHEYGMPGNTLLPNNQVAFIPLGDLYQYLLTHPH